jgi:hypothetical protein
MSSRAGFAIVSCLIVACGSSSGGSSSGSSSNGGSSNGASTSSSGAGTCVNVDQANYDTSCNAASDCFSLNVGCVCDGSCPCGNYAANKSGESRYESEIGSLRLVSCFCPASSIACVNGKCTIGGPGQPPGCPDGG